MSIATLKEVCYIFYENKNSSTKLSYKVQGDTKVESIFLIIPLKSKITWHSASILLFLYIYITSRALDRNRKEELSDSWYFFFAIIVLLLS